MVVRPTHHHQGRHLKIANTGRELRGILNLRAFRNGWYARDLIDKSAEYRVYVMCGKVLNVARKTPGNPNAVAWNVARGGRFDHVRWGDWPDAVCDVALKSFAATDLHFGGVDVMVDQEGRAYMIEINSAPSLPFNSDGSTTIRHTNMAKGIKWHMDNTWDTIEHTVSGGWRSFIHPACWVPREQRT